MCSPSIKVVGGEVAGGGRRRERAGEHASSGVMICVAASAALAVFCSRDVSAQLIQRESVKQRFNDFVIADAEVPRTFHNPSGENTRPAGVAEIDAVSPGVPPVLLLSLSIGPWKPGLNTTGSTGNFSGRFSNTVQPHVMRMNLVIDGLVNPAGPINDGPVGNSGPFAFGSRPLIAVIDLDLDADLDTGGSTSNEARLRYAANIGRFGTVPQGELGERAARSLQDIDYDPHTSPHYERTGEEFSLVLCGCSTPTVTVVRGNQNQQFEAGEAWIVRGRFFRRSSLLDMVGTVFGGSDFGRYDPYVDVLFDHSIVTNRTTVSLVYPITHVGAAMLFGGPTQAPDQIIDVIPGNHSSMEEGLLDVTTSAAIPGNSTLGRSPLRPAVEVWQGRSPGDYLNPADWDVRGVVGTVVAGPLAPAPKIVITDSLGPALHRDVTGDGLVDLQDRLAIKQFIVDNSAGPRDLDPNNPMRVRLDVQAGDFSPFDLTGNGVVSITDAQRIPVPCLADLNGNGEVDADDLALFIAAYLADDLLADLDDDLQITPEDYVLFMASMEAGCP